MFDRIKEDVFTIKMRDPAARSTLEILLCYPGLLAIWFHRVSQCRFLPNNLRPFNGKGDNLRPVLLKDDTPLKGPGQ